MNKDFNAQAAENGELHTSFGDGGYASVFHQTTKDAPLDFSAAINRDPEDVLTISSLLRASTVLLLVLAASVVMNVYLSVRRADRIIVDKTSGRVVELKIVITARANRSR